MAMFDAPAEAPPSHRVATRLLAGVVEASAARSRVVLDPEACADAREMDARSATGAGPSCRGFLFLLDDGELLALPECSERPSTTATASAASSTRPRTSLPA